MASSSTSSDASAASSIKESTIGDGHAAGDVAATTGAFASRAKQALDAWQTLEKALVNISSHQKTFSEVAEAVNRHLATDIELQRKDAEIARLKTTLDTTHDQFTKRFTQWEIDREQLVEELNSKEIASEAKLKVLKQKSTALHAQEVENLKKALESEKKKSAALEVGLEDANKKIEKIEHELVECREEVDVWNDYTSDLKDVDFGKFKAKIKPLFDRCCNLARNHFFRELSEGSFQNEWENKIKNIEVRLNLPPSNSEVAKRVRMAACLHLIARSLCTNIFKPCYIPYRTVFSDCLRETLQMQYSSDPEKERITRALILSTFREDDISNAITVTAHDSATHIRNLLEPLGATEKFSKELEKIFIDAGELWKDFAQHSNKMIEVFTVDNVPDVSWEIMDEFTIKNTNNTTTATTTTTTAAADRDEDFLQSNVVNLFPCIFVPEDNNVLFPGVRLLPSQGIMSAADKEFIVAKRQRIARNLAAGPTGGQPIRARDRRMSWLDNPFATAAATGDDPTQQQQQQQQRGRNGNK